jgi:transcriptional regulator with XRE-family HTH domain
MPRLRHPPDFEIERRISARFRELRELTCQSQARFAKILAVTRDRIANIEAGRTPLRYREARRALNAQEDQERTWPFNPLWLAGEVEWPIQMDWPLLLPNAESLELPQALRFSEFVGMHHSLLVGLTSDPPEPELPATWLQPYLFHWLRLHHKETDLNKSVVFVENVFAWSAKRAARTSARAAHLLKEYNQAKSAMREVNWLEASEIKENDLLTETETCAKLSPVKSQLDKLLAGFDRLVKEPGKKTELARFLGAPLASVSRWLSGKREPGRNVTLKMLRWVEHQQRQQNKGPGNATTPPEPKTQSKVSSHAKEQPRSNRLK